MIDIVIPVRDETEQLNITLESIESFTNMTPFNVHIIKDNTVNVSEARQRALEDDTLGDYILYMDDDAEIIHDYWLDYMLEVLQANEKCAVVFAGEWWGTMDRVPIIPVKNNVIVPYGPAACMLIDRRKLTPFMSWDLNIGLKNTWLGGDFEEVDFCYRVQQEGFTCMRATKSLFHHTGGKTTLAEFTRTDRYKTVQIMRYLLELKYHSPTTAVDDDYFKGLRYVKARDDNMDMLAAGQSLRHCYSHVVARNGLQNRRFIRRAGLI